MGRQLAMKSTFVLFAVACLVAQASANRQLLQTTVSISCVLISSFLARGMSATGYSKCELHQELYSAEKLLESADCFLS